MFVAFDRNVRVSLCLVTLGVPDRLERCLEALRDHRSRHEFTVTVLVNADTRDGTPPEAGLPAGLATGVSVEFSAINLGWAGGLHRARTATDAELLVWVQDDMTPEPGWLDALVDAADARPEVGAFGSVRVDDHGTVLLSNAGAARPPDDVALWNDTDRTAEGLSAAVTTYDWVCSRGLLTRTRAFDEVGGPDPRIWPLSYSDKEYCTHLRCHGWDVALVPGARLRHTTLQTAPGQLRVFLLGWNEPWFNQRWAAALTELGERSSGVVAHPCADWRSATAGPLEAAVGAEASRLAVPLGRTLAAETSTAAQWHRVREEDLVHQVEHYRHAWEESHRHAERLTAALAAAEQARDLARRRVRRLRRRLAETGRPSPEPRTVRSRLRRRLRRWGA